jgi:Protein of unknown function (DUF3352)
MKNNLLLLGALALAALVTPAPTVRAQSPAPADKTSFKEVTSQLDPGGNFYLYLGTAQWLEHLSGKIESWRDKFTSMPDAKPEDVANINKCFDLVTNLVQDSGIENISGVGLSSIGVEKDLYRNKMVMHHYPGTGSGFIWNLGGGAPHPLTGLDFLPTNTALATFSDANLPLLWKVSQDEIAKSNYPRAQDFVQQFPAKFEKKTGVKWDAFLGSLGGEFGLAVTFDESNTLPIPSSSGFILIPEPGLLMVVKVNDDVIFNRISSQLKTNPAVASVDSDGLKMCTMPAPVPLLPSLRPTTATSGGYLFIASSDALVRGALAVKAGTRPGLKSTAEFQRLAQGVPDRGNQFTFISEKFGRTMLTIQQQFLTGAATRSAKRPQADWVKSLMSSSHATYSYNVSMNTPNGFQCVGNANQSAASLVLLPAVAVPGMLAAIAIPNFVRARETAQKNTCINHLRQLDAAKHQWALEHHRKDTDVPTKEDLLPFLNEWPVCPKGGTYVIGPVNVAPTCNQAGHVLPAP